MCINFEIEEGLRFPTEYSLYFNDLAKSMGFVDIVGADFDVDNKSICFDYGVLSSEGNAYRSTFIIDNNMKIRYISANDKRIGREVGDILRIVDVLQSLDKNESICSFGWNENQLIENKTNYLNK